jgi:transcriptional regulator with XRE-family HTH domain
MNDFMQDDSEKSLGRVLAMLREEAGVTQAKLAASLTVSATRVSRMESGDVDMSPEELRAYLRSLGTKAAAEFARYLELQWRHVYAPTFGHPDLDSIRKAEDILEQIAGIRTDGLKSAFVNQLNLLEERVRRCAEYLATTSHSIAFIGSIGVGKTSAICALTGLRIPDQPDFASSMSLAVGSGRTTVCEVRISKGPRYGIFVDPKSDDDIRDDVADFAEYLFRSTRDSSEDDGVASVAGVSEEVARAIRNMAGLARKEEGRDPAGKRRYRYPDKELAEKATDAKSLAVEILARMSLPTRQTRTLWCPDTYPKDPREWLKGEFRRINDGRHPDITIPELIEVSVPHNVLAHDQLEFEVIDTKGVDENAQREDLERHFDDPRTLVVLCSKFNDAPEQACQTLLERAVAAGANRVVESSALLVLAKAGEALGMRVDSGDPVQDVEEGYELKEDQIRQSLARISTAPFNIHFFNAVEDDHGSAQGAIVSVIEHMREQKRVQLAALAKQVERLVQDWEREEMLAVLNQALKRIRVWLDNHRTVDASAEPVQKSLLSAIASAHPRSVWASVRRRGSWTNLDYYYQLGYEARLIAAQHIKKRIDELGVLVQNLVDDPDMAPAHGIVSELFERASDLADALLKRAQITGQAAYEDDLREDTPFWDECEAQWGLGSGYRDRIRSETDSRFKQETARSRREAIKSFIENGWQDICKSMEETMAAVTAPDTSTHHS